MFSLSSQELIASILNEYLRKEYELTIFLSNLTGSSFFIGLISGSFISGKIEKYFGRRNCLIISGFIIFFSSVILGYSPNIGVFIVLRIITGISYGITEGMIYTTISEISPLNLRGGLVISVYIFFALGYIYTTIICFFCMKSFVQGSINIVFILNV